MNGSLHSASWYRVADLRPRLRPHVLIHRHEYRGQTAYVLQDRGSGRNHRCNETAHAVLALMDGERSIDAIWHRLQPLLGNDAPTQDETIQLLGRLYQNDLLQCDVPPDTAEVFQRHRRRRQARWRRNLATPLSVRLPLFDPERFLTRWSWVAAPLFTRAAAVVWIAVVGAAALATGANWAEIAHTAGATILTPHNLLLLWLLYPLVKALHELGHAFATKVWGGEVHEMGVMLLALVPVPYVDASASAAFADRRKRATVGAAGILVELFVASLALFVWLLVEPGLVRDIAFNVMVIGGVSTVAFNGNPLMRFDGYYVLADLIDMPNLGGRANRYLGYLIQRHAFGLQGLDSPAASVGERRWLLAYGVASFVYRIFILTVLILFIAGEFFFVGVALALWAATSQILLPVWRALAFLFTSARVRPQRTRALAVTAAAAGTALALLLFVPLPYTTRTQGVLWLPEQSQVRAGTDCFVEALLAADGAPVRAGDALVRCDDPALRARVKVLEARLQELQARHAAVWSTDRVQTQILSDEMASTRADLELARERAATLVLRSPGDGVLVVPGATDLPGRFVRQGEVIAYVGDAAAVTARVVVSQADVGLVRERTRAVEIRVAGATGRRLNARIAREVPAATDRLPSAALGAAGGGPVAIDPQDRDGLKAAERIFQFELALPAEHGPLTIGRRVYARFHHGSEPLARQWYRGLRQLFLRRFDV